MPYMRRQWLDNHGDQGAARDLRCRPATHGVRSLWGHGSAAGPPSALGLLPSP
jgi:hypothetical protein